MKKFAQWGEERAINAMRNSIANGWRGLFEETKGGTHAGSGRNPESADERRRAKAAREYPEPDLGPPMLRIPGVTAN
jgi:hypothetical protein